VNVTHVPYRSAAVALQDVLGGRIDYVCPILSTAIGQIQADKVKPIAVLSKNRSDILPNVASAHEQGLAGFDVYMWNGFFLPKGAPPAIVNKLHDAIVRTIDTPAVQARIKEIGGSVVASERRSPQFLQQFVEAEIKKWAEPIRATGVSMD
jgi:tripartite-type tricarboxylate transporter receptor subunit TctC